MSRIANVFAQPGHKALIPYITIGYPDIEATLKAVPLLVSNGADIIELGIPFSDPMADGVTIQESSYQALQKGVTTDVCLEIAEKVRQNTSAPLVFMTYINPIFKYGLERFCQACVKAGLDGLIVPDLPPEEGVTLACAASEQGLDLIYLLAPTSTPDRIRIVAEKSRGYIYLVSLPELRVSAAVSRSTFNLSLKESDRLRVNLFAWVSVFLIRNKPGKFRKLPME
jgi:tryptophan synthase alpha chain